MSTYTDYETVSNDYDEGRIADGADVMISTISGLLRRKPEEIHLLEAGCGTGNYSLEFLKNGIGKLTLVDGSQSMLDKAKQKVQDFTDQVVEAKQIVLPNLPYKDNSFDAIAFIQVLHHLDRNHEERTTSYDYPNLCKALSEAYRVLKPKGVLLVNTSLLDNLKQLPIALAPKVLEMAIKTCIPDNLLFNIIKEVKFQNIFYVVQPESSLYRRELKKNFELILHPKGYNFDSGWQFSEKTGEFEEVVNMLKKKKEDGTLEKFYEEFYASRKQVGDHTSIFAQKL